MHNFPLKYIGSQTFCRCRPLSLQPKPLRTPSFCQRFSIIEKLDLVASQCRGATTGGKGTQSTWRRITARVVEKSQQCHKHFLQYSTVHLLPKDLRFDY